LSSTDAPFFSPQLKAALMRRGHASDGPTLDRLKIYSILYR
jgi:hypothetical protein